MVFRERRVVNYGLPTVPYTTPMKEFSGDNTRLHVALINSKVCININIHRNIRRQA